MSAGATRAPKQRMFRIFLSYASEDLTIVTAIASCFKTALPDFFTDVTYDKEFLEPGSPFKTKIESTLQDTNVLIIVYTAAEKPSHGYTGWEVGYFDHIMRTDPVGRKKISLYLYDPPDITSSEQGIPLGLSRDQLQLTLQKFEDGLSVSPEEPLCKEIEAWQEEVAKIIKKAVPAKPHLRSEQVPAKCVRDLKLTLFKYLRGIVAKVVKPQKGITIRAKGSDLEQSIPSLPPQAEIRPLGLVNQGGSMNIFGMADEPITWEKFIDLTAGHAAADSWHHAIATVVHSAFPNRVDVDNGQVILGSDGKTAYQVILTTATTFYDDYRECNLCFVEMVARPEHGDQDTTRLLKGLDLVCRFRSMFLEEASDFLGENVRLTQVQKLPELAGRLSKELNLLNRDAQEAGLDKPGMWKPYVDVGHLKAIADAYQHCESELRQIIPKVIAAKGAVPEIEPLRDKLAEALTAMETVVRPENRLLLQEMAAKLNQIVEHQDRKPPKSNLR
jgi:hypothetical protein